MIHVGKIKLKIVIHVGHFTRHIKASISSFMDVIRRCAPFNYKGRFPQSTSFLLVSLLISDTWSQFLIIFSDKFHQVIIILCFTGRWTDFFLRIDCLFIRLLAMITDHNSPPILSRSNLLTIFASCDNRSSLHMALLWYLLEADCSHNLEYILCKIRFGSDCMDQVWG